MAGRYGMTEAKRHIELGEYVEGVEAATASIDARATDAEAFYDRAAANELLENYSAAADDFETAIRLNLTHKELDAFELDDAYFSLLVSYAKSTPSEVEPILMRYTRILPAGQHASDATTWTQRIRGELPSLLDKTRTMGA